MPILTSKQGGDVINITKILEVQRIRPQLSYQKDSGLEFGVWRRDKCAAKSFLEYCRPKKIHVHMLQGNAEYTGKFKTWYLTFHSVKFILYIIFAQKFYPRKEKYTSKIHDHFYKTKIIV